jgi:hypothetical protein
MEQLIILALVVVFYVGKQLLKKAMSAGKDDDASTESTPMRQPTQPSSSDGGSGRRQMSEQEEKMRKFFEALGLPTTSLPPAPVTPKSHPPPLAHPAAPPPLGKKPRPERKPPMPAVRPSYMPDAPSSVSVVGNLAGPQMASPAEMYASTHISAPALRPVSQRDVSPGAAIALQLRTSRLSLQRAVVINELLGKPLGLR